MEKCNCGKEFETVKSLISHSRWCKNYVHKVKILPDKPGGTCICGKSFDKGLSFTGHKNRCKIYQASIGKEIVPLHLRRKNWKHAPLSEAHKNLLSTINRNNPKCTGNAASPELEILRKEKISKTMKLNPLAGGRRKGSGRGVKQWYKSSIAGKVFLDSTYELRYVQCLDKAKISWKANTKGFEYEWNNEKHLYYPDFIVEDIYVEVKGFKTDKDEAKWKHFPHPLKVVYLEDIEELEKSITK